MPNKIDIKVSVDFRPENRGAISTGDVQFSYEPAGRTYLIAVQSIGTAAEELLLGDVAAAGLLLVRNRDKQNFVELGLSSQYCIKLLPGQAAMFPPVGTIFARANTAAADIELYVFPAEAAS